MERQRAEITAAETAAVVNNRKLHFCNRRNAADSLIARMIGSLIRQTVYPVHFLCRQRNGRRILHQQAMAMLLYNCFSRNMVLLCVLYLYRFCVFDFVLYCFFHRRTPHSGERNILCILGKICRAANLFAHVRSALSRLQIRGDFQHGFLAHTEHQTVCSRILQDGRHNMIRPIIIVRKAAQTRFESAEINRRIRKRTARELRIYRYRTIRTLAAHTAGRIRIVMSPLFGCRIMRHHGVNIAAVNQHRIARLSHRRKIRFRAKIRLGQNCHAIARILQHTRDNRRAKRRMIHIRITGYKQKIAVIPPARHHIFF